VPDDKPISVFYTRWYPIGDQRFPHGAGGTYATREMALKCSTGADPDSVAMEFIRIGEFGDLHAILKRHKRSDLVVVHNDFTSGLELVRSGVYLDARIYHALTIPPFSGIS
jgi:hypothetical protein